MPPHATAAGLVAAPRLGVGSPRDLIRQATNPRFAVVALVFLTYAWRFQELSPLGATLRITVIATVGAWGYLLLQPRADQLRPALKLPALTLMLGFIAWMLIALPFGLDSSRSFDDWTGVHLKTFALLLFVAASASSIENIKRMMAVHIFGATVLAAFYVKAGFPMWGTPVTTYDVNDLALHLNMSIPLVLYFIVASKRGAARAGLWLLVAVFAVCILMTRSRGGFLTLGMLSAVTMVRMKGASLLVRMMPLALLLATYPLLPEDTRARLKTIFSPSSDYNLESEEGRIEIWKRGMGYLAQYPITGVGVHNFLIAERTISARAREGAVRGQVSHNSFVEVAAETGIPGILLYTSSLAIAIWAAFRMSNDLARRRTAVASDAGSVASALGLSMVAFCIGGFFLALAHMQFLMTLIAMTAGLWAVVGRQRGDFPPASRRRRWAHTVTAPARDYKPPR